MTNVNKRKETRMLSIPTKNELVIPQSQPKMKKPLGEVQPSRVADVSGVSRVRKQEGTSLYHACLCVDGSE